MGASDNHDGRLLAKYAQQGMTQIAILVEDLEHSVCRYQKLFGIEPWHFYTYKKPLLKFATYHGRPASYAMRIALSYFGPTRLELIQPLYGDSVYADFVKEHGYGVHHVGLLVPNMKEALQEAQKEGLEMIMDGGGFGLDGDGHYAYLDTYSDLGVTIEFIERPKRRIAPEKILPEENEEKRRL